MGIWASKIKDITTEDTGGFAVFKDQEWVRGIATKSIFFANEMIMFELEAKEIRRRIDYLKAKIKEGYKFLNPHTKELELFKKEKDAKYTILKIKDGIKRLEYLLKIDFKHKPDKWDKRTEEESIVYYAI